MIMIMSVKRTEEILVNEILTSNAGIEVRSLLDLRGILPTEPMIGV